MPSNEFKLQSLILHRDYINREAIVGEVTFEGAAGAIKLNVDAELSQAVLKLVAENMALATKRLADNMTASIFDQAAVPQLPVYDPNDVL